MTASSPTCPVCEGTRLAFYPKMNLGRCPDCGTLSKTAEISRTSETRWGPGNIPAEKAKYSVYEQGLDILERATPGREVLDIGAGSGVFMEFAAARGWKATGVEPDTPRAKEGIRNGNDILIQFFGAAPIDRKFDAVCFWDSLDSIPEPVQKLQEAYKLLRPGGVVLLRLRNGPFNFFILRFVSPWLEWLVHHPAVIQRFGFGDRSIATMFARAGFDPPVIWNSAPTIGDPYGASKGLGPTVLGALKLGAYAAAQAVAMMSLGKLHWGNSLLVYSRRPSDRPLVLHLITRLDPGGSSESTWALKDAWKDEAIDVALAAGNRPDGDDRPVIWLRHLVRNPSWRDLLALWEIYRLLRTLKPAILHTHSSKAGFLGRWAAWWAGVPTVHTPHGHVFYGYFGPLKSNFYWLLEKISVPVTGHFVGLTDGERDESVRFGIGEQQRWSIVPSGTPLPPAGALPDKGALREKLGLATEGQWVGSLLRLERVKGPDILLEAAGLLRDQEDLHFVLIGDGPMRGDLEARAQSLGLGKRFVFAGQQADILSWLGALDIYVQPSRNEGMCRALIQAQALGIPVAASRVCGIPDVAKESVGAVLIPPEDPAALAEAIRDLAQDPTKREKLGRVGREFVYGADELGHRRFSEETMRARLLRLYRRVLP